MCYIGLVAHMVGSTVRIYSESALNAPKRDTWQKMRATKTNSRTNVNAANDETDDEKVGAYCAGVLID